MTNDTKSVTRSTFEIVERVTDYVSFVKHSVLCRSTLLLDTVPPVYI